ncbi:MAG: HNH endonuclease [Chloroflexi bacterium]|nr:MAG: HNH endonuclease [Chloroflexota bacterium]
MVIPLSLLYERLDARTEPEPNTGCWLWTGPVRGQGYGGLYIPNGKRGGVAFYAHRASYMVFRGPIPKGQQLDHLCRVRLCVNPAHLECVTGAENRRRGNGFSGVQVRRTHCPRGHPYDAANTYKNRGHRSCKICFKWHRRFAAHGMRFP